MGGEMLVQEMDRLLRDGMRRTIEYCRGVRARMQLLKEKKRFAAYLQAVRFLGAPGAGAAAIAC